MSDNAITYIGLLQHGSVEAGDVFCGELETALDRQGWKQLKQSFRHGIPAWDAIVTSPRMQCAAFAEWLAQKHDLPLVRDERLREIHFGAWEGRSPLELMADGSQALQDWLHNPAQYLPEGGEHFGDFRARVLDAWVDILRSYQGERVLLVTHAGVIRVILSQVLRIPDERLLALNVEYASLSTLQVLHEDDGSNWTSLLSHGC